MTFTPIVYKTANWHIPLNAALQDLQDQITAGAFTSVSTNPTTSASTAYSVNVGVEAFDRLRILGDGSIQIGPGSGTRDTTWKRLGAAQIGTSDSDVSIALAGKGLKVAEGSNAKMGTATLVAGSSVVATTAVTASSRIFLTGQADTAGTEGFLRVSARSAGVNFTITSSSGTDTSTVAWLIVEPA